MVCMALEYPFYFNTVKDCFCNDFATRYNLIDKCHAFEFYQAAQWQTSHLDGCACGFVV